MTAAFDGRVLNSFRSEKKKARFDTPQFFLGAVSWQLVLTFEWFRRYKDSFLARCRQRGLGVEEPIIEQFMLGSKEEAVKMAFDIAKKKGANYIQFLTSDELIFHGKRGQEILLFCSFAWNVL